MGGRHLDHNVKLTVCAAKEPLELEPVVTKTTMPRHEISSLVGHGYHTKENTTRSAYQEAMINSSPVNYLSAEGVNCARDIGAEETPSLASVIPGHMSARGSTYWQGITFGPLVVPHRQDVGRVAPAPLLGIGHKGSVSSASKTPQRRPPPCLPNIDREMNGMLKKRYGENWKRIVDGPYQLAPDDDSEAHRAFLVHLGLEPASILAKPYSKSKDFGGNGGF